MRKIIIAALSFIFVTNAFTQTVEELYEAKDYQGLAWLEGKVEKPSITGSQAYMFAFAFFQTENDSKAVEYFDVAIKKGYDSVYVHFYKSVCLRYLKKFTEAHKEIDYCIQINPTQPKFLNEKGLIFLAQAQYGQALEVFEKVKQISANFYEPYYWLAYTYAQKKDAKNALSAYYTAKEHIIPQNRYHLLSLTGIGQLEYSFTKDYQKSIKAYTDALQLSAQNYELYFGLIKSYNALKDSTKVDSLFALVKTAFDNAELPKEEMKAQNIIVAEFISKGQNVVIRKSLLSPKNKQDLLFKIFLMDKTGDLIERKFEVIQSSETGIAPKFQLIEQDKTGKENPTPYSWTSEKISANTLEQTIRLILEGPVKTKSPQKPKK
jgi:tetratricopeptide (TPR) repeat protein